MKQERQGLKATEQQPSPRATYLAPALEVIEMQNEGVIATSADLPGYPGDGDLGTPTRSARGYNTAGSSDLEDMINDILTVEN